MKGLIRVRCVEVHGGLHSRFQMLLAFPMVGLYLLDVLQRLLLEGRKHQVLHNAEPPVKLPHSLFHLSSFLNLLLLLLAFAY